MNSQGNKVILAGVVLEEMPLCTWRVGFSGSLFPLLQQRLDAVCEPCWAWPWTSISASSDFPWGGSEDALRLSLNLLESFKKRGAAGKSWAAYTLLA